MDRRDQDSSSRSARSSGSRRSIARRRAFTLIEVLVAIGAIAVISVGLAAIFDSIGKTVSGGRRASVLNTYSQLVERQLSADFAKMSRDGFMVIRQQYVDVDADNKINITASPNPDAVELYRDQPTAERRPRRIDELMFFQKGNFQSARRSLVPGVRATSQEARIYYGHMQRRLQDFDASGSPATRTPYEAPQLDDPNGRVATGPDAAKVPLLGRRSSVTPSVPAQNPNRYASDWILGRHVTLLTQPKTTFSEKTVRGLIAINASVLSGLAERHQYDSEHQISLQPAASTIFRTLARRPSPFYTSPNRLFTAYLDKSRTQFTVAGSTDFLVNFGPPVFSSGIVDIATTDLSEIRQVIDQCWNNAATSNQLVLPNRPEFSLTTLVGDPSPELFRGPRPDAARSIVRDNGNEVTFRTTPSSLAQPELTSGQATAFVDAMHAWMSDAMPTESRQDARLYPRQVRSADEESTADWNGVRMRAETAAPDLVTVFADTADPLTGSGTTTDEQRNQVVRLSDQSMLSASNLLPRCSEFIVDWSFGLRDKTGELIWHGPPRTVNVGGVDVGLTRPYPWAPDISDVNRYRLVRDVPLNSGKSYPLFTSPRLIYGTLPLANADQISLTSYFGWSDPTYPNVLGRSPTPPISPPFDPAVNPKPPATLGTPAGEWLNSGVASYSVPWPWPTLVRVTLTLADPVDPTIETTFQYVFKVPEPESAAGTQ
jgi:prepilin-type N-terminal cleavage/methylation domain-containing protein